MNLRGPALGILVLVTLAGCSSGEKEPTASPLSFAPIANDASAPYSAAGASSAAPVAGAGTVCGSVPVPKDKAAVVIREGRVNCGDALEVARVYAAAAANAEGRDVGVEVGGWRCTTGATDSTGTCRQDDGAFSVG